MSGGEGPDLLAGIGFLGGALEEALDRLRPREKARLESFSYQADESQDRFIRESASVIRLIAPAGCGKTQSIANRVLRSINDGRHPREFLLLTFDNSAASALRGRLQRGIEALLGQGSAQVAVQTLNSFGSQLLHGALQPQRGGLSLAADPATESRFAAARALKAVRTVDPKAAAVLPKLKYRAYVDFVSALKNALVVPAEVARREKNDSHLRLERLLRGTRLFEPWLKELEGRAEAPELAPRVLNLLLRLYLEYCADMVGRSRLDFDDQKLLPYLKLRSDKSLVGLALGPVRTLIVDEFQDVNTLDFEFVRVLSEGLELVVVGDDDQAIYGFRGCSPDYILNVSEHLNRQVSTHVLEVNYRSPKNIVELSQLLIRHNRVRMEKPARAWDDGSASISLWQCANSAAEAQILARAVRKMHDERKALGFQLKDIAVLLRVNSQSLPIQLALATEQIPYVCRKEDNILLSDAMTNLIGLLELHVKLQREPSFVSRESCRLLLSCYLRYYAESDLERLLNAANRGGGLLRGAIEISAKSVTGKARFTAKFAEAVRVLVVGQKPGALVRQLGEQFKFLGGLVATLDEALEDVAPLGELVEIAERFHGGVEELVGRLTALLAEVQGANGARFEGDAVNLLTYFRAKGQQWDTVFIPSANQKVIPHARAPLEDERRLFYVAITRASANLIVSYSRTVVRSPVEPSQFLREMGLGVAEEKRALRT